jgi:hypothetical protein
MTLTVQQPICHSVKAAVLAAALMLFGAAFAQAQFRVGDIVTTNFFLTNRFQWTNDGGQVFTPSNTAIRLSDFDGKIAFFIFFEVW